MIVRHPKPLAVATAAAAVILFLYYALRNLQIPRDNLEYSRHGFGISKQAPKRPEQSKGLGGNGITPNVTSKVEVKRTSILNDTLGFEKIFVINMPERSDKRDALSLMASFTHLKLEFIDGVKGKDVAMNARPFGYDSNHIRENHLGSWRGHMNAIRTMLEQGLNTALILEDDVDWDVHIKDQFRHFAAGSRHISSTTPHMPNPDEPTPFVHHDAYPPLQDSFDSSFANAPYGNNWDVLWLGHCGEIFPTNDDRVFYIDKDRTVPPHDKFQGWFDVQAYPEGTRFIHPTNAPVCTFAYALSRAGAQKILFQQSVNGLPALFDNGLSDMCRDKVFGMKCISTIPPMIVHHRAKGPESADSDINNNGDGGGNIRQFGYTENIVYSVRLNLERLLKGAEPISQWSKEMDEERNKPWSPLQPPEDQSPKPEDLDSH